MKRCTQIADSLVSGEPLSDGDRAHVETCTDCQKLTSMTRLLDKVATATEAGPGFTSRMIAGARERLEARRRQRIVGFGLATAVCAAAAALIVMSSRGADQPHDTNVSRTLSQPLGSDLPPLAEDPGAGGEITDDELRELVGGTSLHRALAPTANWAEIESPHIQYRAVMLHGGEP